MTDRPFDISVKDLAEQDPLSWCRLADANTIDKATVIDADVSTVTASADKVLRAEGPRGVWLVNVEAASSHDAELPGRLHLKSVMLEARHQLPVRSVVILLRRAANARAVSGTLRRCLPGESKAYNTFRYQVIRLWQMPLEPLLTGGLGTLPLAALTDEAEPRLPEVVQRIETRLRNEVSINVADKARTSLFFLLGLRYDEDMIAHLYEGLVNMEDSTTYQATIRKGEARGRLEAAREDVLLVGEKKFGAADADVRQRLSAITDREALKRLLARALDVSSWDELLAPLRGGS